MKNEKNDNKKKNNNTNNIKEKRSKKLIELSNENQKQYNQNLIGKDVEVLFEEKNKEGYYKGHTQNYILVEFKTDEEVENKIVKEIRPCNTLGENALGAVPIGLQHSEFSTIARIWNHQLIGSCYGNQGIRIFTCDIDSGKCQYIIH